MVRASRFAAVESASERHALALAGGKHRTRTPTAPELVGRGLSANRLALDLSVPSGRITEILNGRRSISADTAVRLGRYFGNDAQFWLNLQSQHDIAEIKRKHGKEIARRVRPLD
jgi:addiction module HigA family antidote